MTENDRDLNDRTLLGGLKMTLNDFNLHNKILGQTILPY